MPYRDEKEALRARLTELDRNLSSIDEKTRELSALREGEEDLRRERDVLRRKLRDLDGPRRLPTLDNLSVASPCHEKWDDMVGDETTRFCLKCEKNVYDLSSMTKEAAEALIVAKEGKVCVRFFRRADGTVLTADCPEGVSRKRRRSIAAGLVGASLLAGGGLYASSKLAGSRCHQGQSVMGDIAEVPHEMGKVEARPLPSGTAPATVEPTPRAPAVLGSVAPLPFTPDPKR